VLGESYGDALSDVGSTPTGSTKIIAGRTPDGEIFLYTYGFVLAVKKSAVQQLLDWPIFLFRIPLGYGIVKFCSAH